MDSARQLQLSVGYPMEPDSGDFVSRLASFASSVEEVYASWPGQPSGRSGNPVSLDERRSRILADLAEVRRHGMAINLLFNANCYGDRAVSAELADEVHESVCRVGDAFGLPDSVTTTSPAIAFAVRQRFPGIRVRASVNMRIGTVRAMRMVEDLFDDFCVQRDVNRDPDALRAIKSWADARGKRVSILANSGCLRDCPGQIFHDNWVAHGDRAGLQPIAGFAPHTCWRHLRNPANRQSILQATWIRPEDLDHYAGLVHGIKLSTRIHPRPFQVIRAYAERRHHGNLLDLLEPGNGQFLSGRIVDNNRFPSDWYQHSTECLADGSCETCATILSRVCIAPP